MDNITLKRIDESNFLDCFGLKLAAGQEKYVSNPIRSLAQAYVYYSQCVPFGIYAADKMVGYVMVIYDYDEEAYNIWHMMIDIASAPFGSSKTVLLTCNPENEAAYKLYQKIGFTETGRSDDDEVELGMTL